MSSSSKLLHLPAKTEIESAKDKLNLDDTNALIEGFNKYPSIIETAPLSYSKLNYMVDNNKKVASAYFALSIEKRKDLLDYLTNLDISIHSVEVIKHLICNQKVDDEFVQNYITQSMISIQKIKEKDNQEIKVMVFCRFILFLINEIKIKINQNVLIELVSFCCDFSMKHIPDAQKLYQALESYRKM